MGTIADTAARLIGLTPDEVIEISTKAPSRYRMYKVPKHDGGTRTIFHPASETKALQYAIMYTFLDRLPIHDIAVAYRHGLASPLRTTASKHAERRYTVHLDFSHFFPSIIPTDLLRVAHASFPGLDKGDMVFLQNTLFINFRERSFLAIGAPSSPMVSNVVMCALDQKLWRAALAAASDAVLTRYADDINFSTNRKGACKRFVERVTKILASTDSPKLTLNDKKTTYASTGSARHILGLTVTPEGRVTIGRSRKRLIRALVNKLVNETTSREERLHLRGFLSFCQDVEPGFLNALVVKYGSGFLEKLQRSDTTESGTT